MCQTLTIWPSLNQIQRIIRQRHQAKLVYTLEWTVPVSWEHMGMPSNCDLLCRHPYNLWDASAMEVQATMPPPDPSKPQTDWWR